MNTEHYIPVGQEVGPQTLMPAVPVAVWQPTPQAPAPALTLYQVPVPDAVPVQLPDGRIAWGRPVEHRIDPVTAESIPREPMPAWAKAIAMAAGSLTVLALGGALALRIATPALEGLVDVLDMLWKVALVLATILFGVVAVGRSLFSKTAPHAETDQNTANNEQTIIFAPQIDAGGKPRLIGRAGDVNIQWGNGNYNKQ